MEALGSFKSGTDSEKRHNDLLIFLFATFHLNKSGSALSRITLHSGVMISFFVGRAMRAYLHT